MGYGKRSDSRSPGGPALPQIFPFARSSFHPDPETYPRTTHSIGNGCVLHTSIDLPASSSPCASNGGGNSFALTTWLGITSRSRLNQNSDSCVSTRPLSVIGVGNITSNDH